MDRHNRNTGIIEYIFVKMVLEENYGGGLKRVLEEKGEIERLKSEKELETRDLKKGLIFQSKLGADLEEHPNKGLIWNDFWFYLGFIFLLLNGI